MATKNIKSQMDAMKKAMPTVAKTMGNISAKASGMTKRTTAPNSVLANRAKLDVMAQKATAPRTMVAGKVGISKPVSASAPMQKAMPVKAVGIGAKAMPSKSKGKAIGRIRKASYGTARPMPKM